MGGFTTGRVGTVFVDIEGDLSKLEKAMDAAVPEAAKAGEVASKAFGGGFTNSSLWQDTQGKWRNQLGQFATNAEKDAAGIGTKFGESFGKGAKGGLDDLANAFSTLGLKSSKSLLDASIKADEAFRKISTSGTASAGDIQRAYESMIAADRKWGDSIGSRTPPEIISPGLLQRLQDATPALDRFGAAASSLGTKLSVGVTLPLVGLATASIKAASDMDSLERGLTAVSGSAEEAARQMADMREVAKLPGLGLKEAVEGTIRLQAFGFSAAEAKTALMAFGNAIATVGGGKAELDRVIIQLGQMAGAGKVLTQDLRPIIQTVPQVAAIIKKEFGEAALSEPGAAIEKLGLTSKQAIGVIVTELGKLPKVTGGLKNDLENFQDAMFASFATIGKELTPFVEQFTNAVVPAIHDVVTVFASLPGPVKTAVIELGIFAAVMGPLIGTVGQFVSGGSQLMKLFGSLAGPAREAQVAIQALSGMGGIGGLMSSLPGATTATAGFATELGLLSKAGLFGLAVGAITGVTIALGEYAKEVDWAEQRQRTWNSTNEEFIRNHPNFVASIDKSTAALREMQRWTFTSENADNIVKAVTAIHGVGKTSEEVTGQLLKYTVAVGGAAGAHGQLSLAAKNLVNEQTKANEAVDIARRVLTELTAAHERGKASIADVARAQVELDQAMRKANPTIKEAAVSTLDLEQKYERLATRFREGKATADEVSKAHDNLINAERELGKAVGLTSDEIKKQAEAFKDEALYAPRVAEILSRLPGLNYDQAKAVALVTDEHKKLSEAVFTAMTRYQGIAEAARAGLIPMSDLKKAETDLTDAVAKANPDIDRQSEAFKMLLLQAGLTANSVIQVGQASEGMTRTLVNGITVISGSAAAARDAGNAYRDMGTGAAEAGRVIDILTGKIESMEAVAARARQTMGTDWPGNSQQGLNSAANSGGTGIEGSGGAKISGSALLSLLKQMGAPEDVIDRAAAGMGLVKFGEASYGTQSDLDAITKTFTSDFQSLSESMRQADGAARDAAGGMDALTAKLEAAKNASYGEDQQKAISDFTSEASDLQDTVNRLAGRLYDLRMEGKENEDEYRDLQTQLFQASSQLQNVNQRLATLGVTTQITGAGLQALQASTNALSGAAKVAALNIIATVDTITAKLPNPQAASVPKAIMPNVSGPTGTRNGGPAGGSLVNTGNGKLEWVGPGGVTVVQNINGGTFSSTAFLDEVGKGLVDTLGRDVGAKL